MVVLGRLNLILCVFNLRMYIKTHMQVYTACLYVRRVCSSASLYQQNISTVAVFMWWTGEQRLFLYVWDEGNHEQEGRGATEVTITSYEFIRLKPILRCDETPTLG